MTAALEADPAAFEQLVRVRWRNALITALVTVPPAAAILVLDYRLTLLSILVLTPLLLTVVDAARARSSAKALGSCRLTWNEAAVTLQSSTGTLHMAIPPLAAHPASPPGVADAPGLRAVRAQPDALVLVEGLSLTNVRLLLVPSTPQSAAPFLAHLRRHGVAVHPEKQIGVAIAGFMMGALVFLGIGKIAAVLAAVGLAQIGLWIADRSGPPWIGAGLLAGALVLLAMKSALKRLLLSSAAPADPKGR